MLASSILIRYKKVKVLSRFGIDFFKVFHVRRCLYHVEKAIELDFFGEHVTFINSHKDSKDFERTKCMMALNDFLLGFASRGKTTEGGGNSFGPLAQGSHSFGLYWERLLKCSYDFNSDGNSAPMLTITAVAPLLAHAGLAYMQSIDRHLSSQKFCLESLSKKSLKEAKSFSNKFSIREGLYIKVFQLLLENEFSKAALSVQKILESCPGDVFGIALGLELSRTIGDPITGLRAAGTVASYLNERQRESPGYTIGLCYVSLGFAVSGKTQQAEHLANEVMKYDKTPNSPISSLALAHVYEAEGRVSEGVSLLYNYDGAQNYSNCGFLFFDAFLASSSARFLLQRDGKEAKKNILRLYDQYFERVFDYTLQKIQSPPKNVWWFNSKLQKEYASDENLLLSVFCWLPPTPWLLSQATVLLLILTLNQSIEPDDTRWHDLRLAWENLMSIYCDKENPQNHPLKFCPAAQIISCLLIKPTFFQEVGVISDLCVGLHLMGSLLNLCQMKKNPIRKEDWKQVVDLLKSYRQQHTPVPYGWGLDINEVLEHSLFYAAITSEDVESLNLARSICSENVTFRSNSPEVWWRYSIVLDKLGDCYAAENARSLSKSLSGGYARNLD